MNTITVKRRFGVWQEDAFTVERPGDDVLEEYDGDIEAWALGNMDDIYARANNNDDPTVTKLWEDEHIADLDFPESETEVQT